MNINEGIIIIHANNKKMYIIELIKNLPTFFLFKVRKAVKHSCSCKRILAIIQVNK